MTIWNHTQKGRIVGDLVRVADNGKWCDIRLTENQRLGNAGDIIAVMVRNLDEDRTGTPGPALPAEGRHLIWPSPDCRDENHQKCDGVAWDLLRDQPTDCGCACHG